MSRDVFDIDLPPLVFSVTFCDKTRATYPPFERHVTFEWPLCEDELLHLPGIGTWFTLLPRTNNISSEVPP